MTPTRSVEPFEARVHPDALDDLVVRLGRTRWPADSPGEAWAAGTDAGYLRDLVRYWARDFDWRGQEARLNAVPQFRVRLDGFGIHLLHQRGRGPAPFPLVVTHGWPGSVFELLHLIPRLADPARFGADPADAFDVVVPSLPGYGFSDIPTAPGMHPVRVAELWLDLMQALGYRRFGTQGGDWGATVATRMALLAPDRVAGVHLNYLPGSYRPPPGGDAPTQDERRFLAACESWYDEEGAYAHLQRTRPATAGFALTDSPVGLAAWIVEKLRAWSDCGGDLERRLPRDEVLANITLYWVTGTIGSSMRLYYEARRRPLQLGPGERVRVPTGFALFPAETPANPPRSWVERGYDVVRWEAMPRGGHFAAWEEPDLLAAELRDFFRPLRGR
jgi:pimeloyl-ACP methyl ester carboxylesterase